VFKVYSSFSFCIKVQFRFKYKITVFGSLLIYYVYFKNNLDIHCHVKDNYQFKNIYKVFIVTLIHCRIKKESTFRKNPNFNFLNGLLQ